MISKDRKAETARENNAKSKGTIIGEGEEKCAPNAINHGERAEERNASVPPHSACVGNEDRQAYDKLCGNLTAKYLPADEIEQDIVGEIADFQWKSIRNKQMESAIFNREITRQAAATIAERSDLEISIAAHEALTGNRTVAELRKDTQICLRAIAQLQRRLLQLQKTWPAATPVPPVPEKDEIDEQTNQKSEDSPAQNQRSPLPDRGGGPERPSTIPTVSAWAESKLTFRPTATQRSVLDYDAPRLIFCCSRQWGKSAIIAIKALHTAIFQPCSEIVVISDSLEQVGLLFNRIHEFAARLGFPRVSVPGCEHSLQLSNGSRIFGVANSGKNFSATFVIVNDAALVQDDVIGSATPANGNLWLLSTPGPRTGLFYNVWHATDLTGWFKVKATVDDSPYASTVFIKEQKRLFPFNFRQDFYCEFTPP